jgi:ABC-type uncharacterized transport system ATPase subunit
MTAMPHAGLHQPSAVPVLYVTVVFDGFKALNALSLVIEPGELRAIIGPNGAGKTTMMDIITGKTRPDAGEVFFGDRDLTKLDEADHRQSRHRPQVPEADGVRCHTVFDNLELALKAPRGVFPTLHRWVLRSRSAHAYRRDPATEIGLTHRATISRPISPTGRSSGWRSACCWRRSRSCCWWTSRWRG